MTSWYSAKPLVAPLGAAPTSGVAARGPATHQHSELAGRQPTGIAATCPTTVHLLGVPSIARRDERILVPDGSKRLVALVTSAVVGQSSIDQPTTRRE